LILTSIRARTSSQMLLIGAPGAEAELDFRPKLGQNLHAAYSNVTAAQRKIGP
jgi:hypothetical protein